MMVMGNSMVLRYTQLASGMVSHGSVGSGNLDEGIGAIVLAALLGAFCGLLFGLILSHVLQYMCFLMGRHFSGYPWTIASVVLGAALFAIWALIGEGDTTSVPPIQGLAEN